MRVSIRLSVAVAFVVVAETAALASVQPQMLCWSPDVEFPVICEEEDEDDERRVLRLTWPARRGLVPDVLPWFIEDQR
jgi:hypothetical protein